MKSFSVIHFFLPTSVCFIKARIAGPPYPTTPRCSVVRTSSPRVGDAETGPVARGAERDVDEASSAGGRVMVEGS